MKPRHRRQRYAPPDGLDWRDPDLPVLVPWKDGLGQRTIKAIGPREEQRFRQQNMLERNPLKPNWRDDPTYKLGKKKRRQL